MSLYFTNNIVVFDRPYPSLFVTYVFRIRKAIADEGVLASSCSCTALHVSLSPCHLSRVATKVYCYRACQ